MQTIMELDRITFHPQMMGGKPYLEAADIQQALAYASSGVPDARNCSI